MKVSLNDTISNKYVRLAEQYGNYSYEQCEKMKYALKVMSEDVRLFVCNNVAVQ